MIEIWWQQQQRFLTTGSFISNIEEKTANIINNYNIPSVKIKIIVLNSKGIILLGRKINCTTTVVNILYYDCAKNLLILNWLVKLIVLGNQ